MAELADSGLLWTVDMLMDGVDFDSSRHDWYDVGRKALAVSLSDCAAMAVQPVAALCAVALSNRMTMDDALALHRGAADLARRYQCAITGGDTNSWDKPTVIATTVAARPVPGCPPVSRGGGRAGNRVYVTGRLGGSILGRYLTFEPRIDLALAINGDLRPHAMIDISDGLSVDLAHIAAASGCGAVVDETRFADAIHPDAVRLSAQDGSSALDHALHDGEDFELIVVVGPETSPSACTALGLIQIGELVERPGIQIRNRDGSLHGLPARGWEHFR
jgi:thiamine-monophosphate kinase